METIIISIVCLALIVFGGMTMSQGFMTSVDAGTAGLKEIGLQEESRIKTLLVPLSASQPSSNTLEITLENDGQTKLADFMKWDLFAQYYDGSGDYHIQWLPYSTDNLSDNEWEVVWIKLSGGSEIVEPGVLNPGEQMLIRAQLDPPVGDNTTNLAVVVTPGGISCSTYFSP